ncbi:MAG: 16S rRNA (cytosine(1402)-N(4))-methyltransferase RsmH [Acidimicrobiia bacterium]
MERSTYHQPVMAAEVVDLLVPAWERVIVDGTFGGGGHTRALLAAKTGPQIIALDRDPDAASNAVDLGPRVRFHLADFRQADRILEEEEINEIDGAVLDLGVSSHQLDVGERGFSYRVAGPLDMRMGPDSTISADDVVNRWSHEDLAGIIRRFGEDRHAGRIAAAIVRNRPIGDTGELAAVVADAVPARSRDRGHPARRTFQAIRVAVNDELAALADGLDVLMRLLRPGGRLVVISYHSLEDRVVKRRFVAGARGCVCPPDFPVCGCGREPEFRIITRGAVRPSSEEVETNPRARSARLRAVERV